MKDKNRISAPPLAASASDVEAIEPVARVAERERWQSQTLKGGADVPPNERGDCFRACVASILDVPIDTLPNPHEDFKGGWHYALAPLGYELLELKTDVWWPVGYWIAELPSLNLPGLLHVVVMQGQELVHDPALGDTYNADSWTVCGRGSITNGWTIAPLDIATRANHTQPTTSDPISEAVINNNPSISGDGETNG